MRKLSYFIIYALSVATLLTGCGDIVPVWVGEIILEDHTLYYTDLPRELDMVLESEEALMDLRLELEVTYYAGMKRSQLPIFIAIEDGQNPAKIQSTKIKLKENGEWIGERHENEIDYILTHEAISSIKLKPGKYKMKIYANDEEAEKIVGVIKIIARMYQNSNSEDAA